MKTPRRTEPLTAAFDCTSCGNTVHFTAGRPDRDPSTGGLICASCKFAPPAAPAAVVVAGCLCADIDGSDRPCLVCDAAAFVSPASTPIPAAPISETRPAPRPVVPLTSEETITALSASVERVAPPPSVTAADLSRHAVRMRKAGLPVDELDPHERARLSLSRSHRIGCAS